MLILIALMVVSFLVGLIGWTVVTLVTKKESEKLIKVELSNMFKITSMFAVSIKTLIQILMKSSFTPKGNESTQIDEQLLKFVPPVSKKQEDDKAA